MSAAPAGADASASSPAASATLSAPLAPQGLAQRLFGRQQAPAGRRAEHLAAAARSQASSGVPCALTHQRCRSPAAVRPLAVSARRRVGDEAVARRSRRVSVGSKPAA